jgi:NADH-quinone oxidoreductase E subunit
MPLLTLAQEQNANWLPVAAMNYVADMLGIPHMRAYEVATFYTMYNLGPVGRHMIEVCTTTPCWLRGSDTIVNTCRDVLGIDVGETTPDGEFTLKEAECLAACVNAPMVQIGAHYYEDLDADSMRKLIEDLRAGRTPKTGSHGGRHTCEPFKGVTTLIEEFKKPDQQKSSAKADSKTKAHSKDAPNVPSEDEPKAKHKNVRKPAVDTVPTTEEAKKGKKPAVAKESNVKSTPAKARKTQLDGAATKAKPKKK